METFAEHYESMKAALEKHMPGVDMALIDKAVSYADAKHCYQKRKDGSPYIIHPLATAQIVAEMGLDLDAILGALLHDCIEDTDTSYEDVSRLFGNTVAELVQRNQEDMMKVRNLGKKSLEEVEQKLQALGLGLRPTEE